MSLSGIDLFSFPEHAIFFRITSIHIEHPSVFFDFAPNILLHGQSCKISADVGSIEHLQLV